MNWWKPSNQLQLRRVMARWKRYDLIAIDEVGYVPLADVGAEFLFQVISERAETGGGDRDDELAVLRMDDGVSESATMQGAAGSDHGPGAHYRDRDGIVSLPANDGKEEEEVRRAAGRAVFATPASVTPKRRRPTGVARLHSRRGGRTNPGRMGQTINIRGGPN